MAPSRDSRALRWALDVARGRGPDAGRLFLIEGRRAIRSALEARAALLHAFVASDAEGLDDELVELARRGVPLSRIDRAGLERLARTKTPQGMVLVCERPVVRRATLLAPGPALGVYLDRVQDPGNVGAIVRSAAALGATFVACGPGTADPFSPRAARAAAGAELRIPLVDDAAADLTGELQAHGFTVVLAEPESGEPATALAWPVRALLVLGSEGEGISPELRARAGVRVRISLAPGAGSLNVAQTAAILLFARASRC